MLEQDALRNIMKQLQIPYADPDHASRWAYRATKWDNVTTPVTIALVGKYTGLGDSYLSVTKALLHSSIACDRKLDLLWIEASDLEEETKSKNVSEKYEAAWESVKKAQGVSRAGWFRRSEARKGKMIAAKFARENKVPYLGICLGMQCMVIEYARNVLGLGGRALDGDGTGDEEPGRHLYARRKQDAHGRHDASRQSKNHLPNAGLHLLSLVRIGAAR